MEKIFVHYLLIIVSAFNCDLETECVFLRSLGDNCMPRENGKVMINGTCHKAWDGKYKSAIAFFGKRIGISFQQQLHYNYSIKAQHIYQQTQP